MARATRIILDLTLDSIKLLRPVIINAWSAAKGKVLETKARKVMDNIIVEKMEKHLSSLSYKIESIIQSMRDKQLPKEKKYLEKEIEIVKKRIEGGGKKSASKTVQSNMQVAWKYIKVECAPPMTGFFLNGPIGQNLENTVSKAADGFINAVQGQIKAIHDAEIRKKREEEEAIKAALKKAKEDEQKKIKEAERKALMAQVAKEEAAAEKSREAAKKAAENDKKNPPKGKAKEEKDPKKDKKKAPKPDKKKKKGK